MSPGKKKLLVVAYSFPPAGGVAVYRTLKFVKYLPYFGWEPVVLTVSNGRFAKYDESHLAMVPEGVAVHRAWAFELLNEGEHRGKKARPARPGFWFRVHRRLCVTWAFFTIPDPKVTWVPAAVWKGWRVMKAEGIRHVYVSGKPFSSFLIGYLLKLLTGAKLVLDYRDPWTQNITYSRRTPLHRWLEKKMEAFLVRNADGVIANTKVNEERLVAEFGRGLPREKFVTIHNGFDGEDFARAGEGKFDKFTVTYAGAFYFSMGSSFEDSAGNRVMETYSPLYFFSALKMLFKRRPELREDIRVKFMGLLGHGYDPIIEDMGLKEVIERLGFLEYDEHIRVLKASHVLLLVLSRGEKSKGWIPSKFFQYLGSGNPVLAMVPEGEVREIMKRTGGGIFVDPDDTEGAAAALSDLYDRYREERLGFDRNEGELAKFERRHLTGLLVDLLETVSGA